MSAVTGSSGSLARNWGSCPELGQLLRAGISNSVAPTRLASISPTSSCDSPDQDFEANLSNGADGNRECNGDIELLTPSPQLTIDLRATNIYRNVLSPLQTEKGDMKMEDKAVAGAFASFGLVVISPNMTRTPTPDFISEASPSAQSEGSQDTFIQKILNRSSHLGLFSGSVKTMKSVTLEECDGRIQIASKKNNMKTLKLKPQILSDSAADK